LKILLADDSLTAQNMGKKILTEAGYDVVAVSNGAQALKKIAAEPPDLVVLDVYMPGYTGLELCERMRNSRETARTPVVLSVGKMEAFKSEEVTRVRADGLIIKPFEATELLAVVKKLEEKVPSRLKRQPQAESEPEVMDEPTTSEPTPPESEFEIPHAGVEIPREMASTPAIGMDLIPEEAPAPPEPVAAAPIEFEVERDPEPVKVEEGPRMASAAGLSGVFEVEPTAPLAAEKPAAPAPMEEFERFSAPPEGSAVSQPAPETSAGSSATTTDHDFHTPQASGGEAECAPQDGPLAETWSELPADPSPLEYAVGGTDHLQPEASIQGAPSAPEALHELNSWDEPVTSLPGDAPHLSASPVLHDSAAEFVAAGPVWVAEEAEIEADELAIPLHQQMQRVVQVSEMRESEPPASPAASAEASLPAWELSGSSPDLAQPTADLSAFDEAAILPEFELSPHLSVGRPGDESANTELDRSSPDSPAGEAQPAAAPEMGHNTTPASEFMPQATVPMVTEATVDPARIASLVEQALERLKPELIAAVTRELEKKNQ
jgi:CheY-like chemotaxis protein